MAVASLDRSQWLTIAAAVLVMSGVQLDFGGISVVLPPMGADLDLSSAGLEWVLNAQLLAFAPPVIAIGRLADRLGQRRLALVGAALFAASTFAIGFVSEPGIIIALRALQGIGAATTAVTAIALVSLSLDDERRGVGIGLFSGGIMAGTAVGPLVAGALSHELSWRWLFYVNGGLTCLGFVALLLFVKAKQPEKSGKPFDVTGFLILTGALLALVMGLQLVERLGWHDPWVIGCLLLSLLLFALFYPQQRRAAAPLVDFALLTDRDFAGACLFTFMSNFPFAAVAFLLTLYLQYIMGFSAQQNGIIFLAMMIPMALAALLGGRLVTLISHRLALSISMAAMAFAFACLGFLGSNSGLLLLLVGLVLFGSSRGLMFGLSSPIALTAAPAEKAAAASGLLIFARNIAAPLGVSLAVASFRLWEHQQLGDLLALAGQEVSAAERTEIYGLLSGSETAKAKISALAPEAAERVHLIVGQAFAHGFRNVMLLGLGLAALGMLSAFIIRPRPQSGGS